MLGIFAAHAQNIGEGKLKGLKHGDIGAGTDFVQQLVPFYAGCLIEVRSSFLYLFSLTISFSGFYQLTKLSVRAR